MATAGSGESAPGTYTFMLTDVEGSTRLWEEFPDRMGPALARHDAIVSEEVAQADGALIRTKGEGDSAFAVFDSAGAGAGAAIALQRRLRREPWELPAPIHVRIAIHTGEAEHREGDYYGVEVNRTARLRAIAYGGQVLVSGTTAALVRTALPDATDLLDLGIHRLKDLSAAEHVFQLVHPDLASDFPPLQSLDARPNNLPVELTSFVGRERELAEIGSLVTSHRLVTLLGPGGTGKTRLALQAAGDLIEKLPDGAWLVQLAPVTDPELVAQTVLNDLRLPESPSRSTIETIVTRLRDRALLLVVDNCEQVADAACSLVQHVLETCPDVRVLATSRERLGARGEAVYQVEPISASDAAELFAERARLVKAGFELTDDNLSIVEAICRRVDSLPLAIELAASRVRVMPPRDILERVTETFRILRGTDRARIGRHESLGAAIDWSYSLLDDNEQSVFRRLAVFVGGFGILGAEAVCTRDNVEPDDVLEVLARLVDKSMVVAGEGFGGVARHRLLETMREYALDRLSEAGEDRDARCRHLAFYRALAEQVNLGMDSADQLTYLERSQEEIDNFRAALGFAHADGDDDAFLQLAGALGMFWYRKSLHEGYDWLVRRLPRVAESRYGMRAAIWATRCAVYSGDLAEAVRLSEEALRLARSQRNPKWVVRALTEAAQARMKTEEFALAFQYVTEAIETARRLSEPMSLWEALHRASTVELLHGSADRARTLALEALELARRPGADPVQLELTLYDAAWSAVATGHLAEVPGYVEETFDLCMKHGDEYGVAMSLNVMAITAAAAGDARRALRLGAAGARQWERGLGVPDPAEQRMLDEFLGRARDRLGAEDADRAWEEGWSMSSEHAVALALQRDTHTRPERALTAREVEIAELVAEGLTDREIADKLVLSERTVDAHLDNVRNKLGLRKRGQITAWVTDRAKA